MTQGRDQKEAPTSQGRPRIANKHQAPGETREDFPYRFQGETVPCQHLNFRVPAPRIVRQEISVALSYSGTHTLLEQS